MAVVPSTDAKNQHQNDDKYQHCRSSFLLNLKPRQARRKLARISFLTSKSAPIVHPSRLLVSAIFIWNAPNGLPCVRDPLAALRADSIHRLEFGGALLDH
jgi:hypothetical protein